MIKVSNRGDGFACKHKNGFTLLEVLIAIAIFSVVSLASFTIFDTVLNSDEKSKKSTAKLNELQSAFLIIERDMLQMARRRVRLNGEKASDDFVHTDQSNFSSSEQLIGFVRNGWTNPGLLLPRGDMQSVAYQLNDGVLQRLHYNFVDAVVGEEPKIRELIHDVNELNFEFYNGKKWQKQLNSQTMPQAVAIEVDIQGYGFIRRQFLVAGDKLAAENSEKTN